MSPLVSVIVPSYNHKKFIGLLIDSIYAQTYPNFEVIILDDGSKDGSPEYLKEMNQKYPFQLILKENEGLCPTLNKGIKLAKGKYIVTIGSDDIIPPERLKEQVSFLESKPDVDIVAGKMDLINEQGQKFGEKTPAIMGNITFKDMLLINRVSAPTAMIRASVFERFGLYPENLVMEDYYLWLTVLKGGGKIVNTNFNWAFYRIINTDLERKFNWYYRGIVQVLDSLPDDAMVEKQKVLNRLIYSIKLVLLLGRNFRRKYAEVYKELKSWQKFLINLISITPNVFRNLVLKTLKISA